MSLSYVALVHFLFPILLGLSARLEYHHATHVADKVSRDSFEAAEMSYCDV